MPNNSFPNLFFTLALCTGLLIACGGDEPESNTEPSPTPESTEVSVSATATAESSPTPVPTATATPLPPLIEVDYQVIDENGELIVSAVRAPVDSWLAVYPDSRLELSDDLLLGYTAVSAGESSDVVIELAPDLELTNLQIALHEQDDPDLFEPSTNSLLLIEMMEIDTLVTLPSLTVSDQTLSQNEEETDGYIVIDAVDCPTPAWVALYPADDDERVNLLGYAPVPAGGGENIPLFFRWRDAPSHLQVVLLEDRGEPDMFEVELDQPLALDGKDLAVDVRVTMPPNILIYSQPAGASFVVEQIISDGPGWLVMYEDGNEDGQPGFIIGSAPLEDGLNRLVEIEVDATAVSTNMLVTLHYDTTAGDDFDFPANDPRQNFGGIARFTTFRTDVTGLLLTDSRRYDGNLLTVPRLAVGQPVWAAVYGDEEGRRTAEPIGLLPLEAGYYSDIDIELEQTLNAGDTVYIVLHQDGGEIGEFEPADFDFILKHRGIDVTAEITLR